MSIIIRLQNLPWSANALDIRTYFTGLQIPEGGVHIVGGELGDAFIAFSTDEDARQAFLRSDGNIKSVQIKLMLSSRTEMQRVIEQARTQSMAAFMLPTNTPVSAPLPAAVPPVIPAAVPEIKRDSKEKDSDKKKDRKRSRTRSKSRDKRDRSRDRKDRRHRDRSRSRSRDRRDRRRRDRSKSRNRSRDRDARRKERGKSPKRDEREDILPFQREARKVVPEVWANRSPQTLNIIPPEGISDTPALLGAFPLMAPTKRNIMDNMGGNLQTPGLNGFPGTNQGFGIGNPLPLRPRDSWPPANVVPAGSVPLVVSAAQRRDSFGRSPDNFQVNQNHFNSNRGAREEPRRDFNNRDKERVKATPAPQFDRSDNNGRRSRFDDNDSPPVNSCVSMEPFYGSYGDLRRFFNGLNINYKGIKVINDEMGKKTGTCFVQFRNPDIKNDALKMNGWKLNNFTVKIQHIGDKMFEDAVDRYNPRMDESNWTEDPFGRSRPSGRPYKNPVSVESFIKDYVCLKVEDLPTFVKEQDILHIFSQHPLISLHLNIKPKGGTVAYVKFSSKEVAKLAFEEKSHHVISGKPVTVRPCSEKEFDQVNKEQNDALETNNSKDIGTDCLSISRLPIKTSDRDISDFFSDIGVIPTKIHLMSNNMGFTGQAYCEFETTGEAGRAATKNSTVLGQNTVSVQPISRSDMESILGNTLPHPGVAAGLPLPPGTPLPSIKTEPLIKSESRPKSESLPAVNPDLNEAHPKPAPLSPPHKQVPLPPPLIQPLMRPGISLNLRNPDNPEHQNGLRDNVNDPRDLADHRGSLNRPRGGFDNRDDFNGTRGGPAPRGGRFGPHQGPRLGEESSHFSNTRLDNRPKFNARGNDGPRFNNRRDEGPAFNAPMDEGAAEDTPGCTVYMENVPYKAGTNEILDFFDGYNCTNNVSRRYNPNNTPSAEAKVTFYTPDDAFRAVQELHGAKIWGRSIFLRQA